MTSPALPKLTTTQWLICIIASIGFAFDIYELLMLPLILKPAIMELAGLAPGSPGFQSWVAKMFYIPALAGGVFGLLGGYMTDLFGRRRILTYSILLYAFSAFAAGFSTSLEMLLFFRCTTFIGVCVEFVAAVAWLAELFDHPTRKEKVLGFTQAFSSFGGLLVAVAYGVAVAQAANLPAIHLPDWLNFFGGTIKDPHAAWRYTLMSGLIPAIPLILIRPFLPESPKWKEKKAAGTLRRPSLAQLFTPEFRRVTIVTTLMFALSYGAAFGAIQHMPRILPGLPEVRAKTEGLKVPAAKKVEEGMIATMTKVQEVGGLAGRFAFAGLALYIISRRKLLRMFLLPGIVLMPVVFAYALRSNLSLAYGGMFLIAFCTIAQMSFWGNYLPRMFPLHLRATGESFAANVGGRMIGTSFAALTASLAVTPIASEAAGKLALTAAAVGTAVYVGNFLLSFLLPEPPKEGHHD